VLAHTLATGLKRWGHDTHTGIAYGPVAIGSTVGAVNQRGVVVCLDAASGALKGRGQIFGGVETEPVVAGPYMVIASLDQSLYGFTAEAEQRWRYRTSAPLRVQPSSNGSTVYCEIPEQGVTAFDANNGKVLWKAPTVKGTVIGSRAGRLIAWDGTTAVTLDPKRGDVFDRVTLPSASNLTMDKFTDGNLYVTGRSGVVAKFLPR
jgi:outer membrane protein assembly factor BamB